MKLQDLQGKDFNSQLEAVATYTGVPANILRAQWMKESSGGKNNTGPLLKDGERARGPWQIKDSTRKVWESRMGETYDPYDATSSLFLGALTMKENMTATRGNVADALRMYNSGTNRSKWNNPETVDYVATVMGGSRNQTASAEYIATAAKGEGFNDRTFNEIFYGHSTDKKDRSPKPPAPKVEDYLPKTALAQPDQRTNAADSIREVREDEMVQDTTFRKEQGPMDKLGAVIRDSGVTAALHRTMARMEVPQDPEFQAWRNDNIVEVAKMANGNQADLQALLYAQSKPEVELIQKQLQTRKSEQRIINAGGGFLPDALDATIYNLVGGVIGDPAGMGVGFVTGGAFKAAGVGGYALAQQGRLAAGVSSLALEGALGNMGAMGLVIAAGDSGTVEDVLYAGATGAIMNGGIGFGSAYLDSLGVKRAEARVAKMNTFLEVQQANPHLSPEQVAEKVVSGQIEAVQQFEAATLADGKYKLFPTNPEEVLLNTPEKQATMAKEVNADMLTGDGRGQMAAELYANAAAINAAVPTDAKALSKFSGVIPKGQSTGVTMLKSADPLLNASAKVLVENTTGAGGRQFTASLQAFQHERKLKETLKSYHSYYDEFRKAEGYSLVGEHLGTQEGYKAFNKRVYWELQNRMAGNKSVEANSWVKTAADDVASGFKQAGELQHKYKTTGFARIDTSKTYMPQRMSVEKWADLNNQPDVKRAVIEALSESFQTLNNFKVTNKVKDVKGGAPEVEWKNFDKAFSDDLARKYVERVMDKQYGAQQMSLNISEPWAAEFVEGALEAMGVPKEQLLDAMGSMARGGAGHTKGRLEIDMFKEIPDGAGGVQKMGDLFEYDMPSLYHGYVRRAAGEAALAQNGIMGAKGLKMIEQAVINRGLATPKEIDAFRQISSELLNQSVGNRHVWMDNLSMATSAAKLGSAVFNQLGEFSAGTLSLGIARTLNQIPQLGRLWRDVGLKAKGKETTSLLESFDQYSGDIGMDEYHSTGLFNTRDYEVQVSGGGHTGYISRVLRDASKAQYMLSLHRRLVAMQTRGAAEQIIDKVFYYSKNGKQDKALADMGLGPSLRQRIKENADLVGDWDKKGKLKSLDMSKGNFTEQEMSSMVAVIDRGAGQIIQRTYVGETAPWVHDSLTSLLYKFRSYSLTATEKQWTRNAYVHGHAMAFVALTGSMAWAMPIYMSRVHMRTVGMSEEKAKEYRDRWLNPAAMGRALLNYSNLSGMAGDMGDVGTSFIGAWGNDDAKEIAGKMRGSPRGMSGSEDLIGGTLAPPVGFLNDLAEGVLGGKPKNILKSLPGANWMGAQPFFNFADQMKDDEKD